MFKIGLTVLTIEPQFWPNGLKIVVIRPPPLFCSALIKKTGFFLQHLDASFIIYFLIVYRSLCIFGLQIAIY
jgi:hypothetical protein